MNDCAHNLELEFEGTVIGGPRGPQGRKGDTGAPGGIGDKGPTGDKGATGDTGNKGATGDQGPRGNKGISGDRGPMGATPMGLAFGQMHVNEAGNLLVEYYGDADESDFNLVGGFLVITV